MNITRINNHKLVQEAFKTPREYLKKCNPSRTELDPPYTLKESYAIDVVMSISNVISCLDQLYHSIDMLSGYRKANSKMNRYDYIVFGIENYYLRLTSVFDRCLRLVNIIFQFGLPERECKDATIIKNEHIKDTYVAKALKNLNRFTQQFSNYRNTIAHSSTYSERKLNLLGAYYLVAEEDDGIQDYFHFYKHGTDLYIKERKAEFKKNLDELETYVEALFDALYAPLLDKLNNYK